jgi:hypothetical protein
MTCQFGLVASSLYESLRHFIEPAGRWDKPVAADSIRMIVETSPLAVSFGQPIVAMSGSAVPFDQSTVAMSRLAISSGQVTVPMSRSAIPSESSGPNSEWVAAGMFGGAAATITRPDGKSGIPHGKSVHVRVEGGGRAFPAYPPAADLAKAPSLDAAATNGQI